MDTYITIAQEATDEFVERRSKFIGHISPASTEEEALAFIARKKIEHREATHNVYAYILQNGVQRYSDDGEPQGTAGIPALDVLRKEQILDVAVVVTRYFGGILLGAGGLVRAYSHSAKLALDAATRKTMRECVTISLEFSYDFYGKLSHMLQHYSIQTLNSNFGTDVCIELLIPISEREAFQKELTELSAGIISPNETGRCWAEI